VQVIDELGNKKRKFRVPMENFRIEAEKHLENILVSCKNKNKVVTKNKNIFKSKTGSKSQITLTPRGQLHKDTIYGKIQQYETREELVGAKFDEEMISKVISKKYRDALFLRLKENGNDPKKAFAGKNSLDKSPIYLDIERNQILPSKLKIGWLEHIYCIRKVIDPENFPNIKSIDNIIDIRIKKIVGDRLQDFNGNAKEAFSNLDKNPIFLNKEKNITIKRVTISGVKNVEALHHKKNHLGHTILDNSGNKIPVDFVSTQNNHHVCIYRDQDGHLQDIIITFFEAVERANQGLPIVDKLYNQHLGWQFLFTMKQNEMFIFPSEDLDPNEIDLINPLNNKSISNNLFRVQTISKVSYPNQTVRDYKFRHHLETSVEDNKELKDITYKSIKSLAYFEKIIKVRINHIGKIVKIGEY
jgi:CRISPR-associated endonuclease Csn1